MRRELHCDRFACHQCEFLLNFSKVPVFGNTIRPHALIAFNEEIIQLGFTARAADPAK